MYGKKASLIAVTCISLAGFPVAADEDETAEEFSQPFAAVDVDLADNERIVDK